MFEKINGPTDQYSGPATGLTTEKGDSWHTAVKKINDGFANIIHFLEGGTPAIENAVESGWEKVAHDLAEAMSLLQIRHDALEAKVKAMSGDNLDEIKRLAKAGEPLIQVPPKPAPQAASFGTGASPLANLGQDAPDPDGNPATGGAPEPEVGKVTTTGPVSATSNG